MRIHRSALVAGLSMLVAWSSEAPAQRADFNMADNGRSVRLFNPIFTVALPENAGTGYSWQLGPSHGVILVAAQSATNPHPPGMVGVPGVRRLTLRAKAPRGDLTLLYVPPGKAAAEKTFRLRFTSAYAPGNGN